MPLTIQLEDERGEIRVGSEPQAVIRYRRTTTGDIEDSLEEATGKAGEIDKVRYSAALWGRVILGWDGLFDPKGQAVPFEVPVEVLERVRAQLAALQLKLPEPDVRKRAQGEWVRAVVRGLPLAVKVDLQKRVDVGTEEVAKALGNFDRSSDSA